MIEIQGDYLEGGGQILRTAIAFSAVTGKPCRIINIRSGRCNPGLQAQHLEGIKTAATICNGKLKGAELGSTGVEFSPGKIHGGDYKTDVGTAGSITLVLQTIVIPAIHADREIRFEITGGTHVRWSPSTDYFQHIFCWYMKKMGIDISLRIDKYGFYPKGGGKVSVIIKPSVPKNITLTERGKLLNVRAESIASQTLDKARVAERQIKGAEKIMKLDEKNSKYADSASPGSSMFMYAEYENCRLGSSSIGEIRKSAEDVGVECAQSLKKQINSCACLDEHMSDQILPFIALAGRRSEVSVADITNHVKTNIWVLEKFTDARFVTDEKKKIISCNP